MVHEAARYAAISLAICGRRSSSQCRCPRCRILHNETLSVFKRNSVNTIRKGAGQFCDDPHLFPKEATTMTRSLLVPALAFAAFAQQAAPPAFEVASVKVSDPNPPSPGSTMIRMGRGCRRPDPGMVNCTNATLKMLLAQAYD